MASKIGKSKTTGSGKENNGKEKALLRLIDQTVALFIRLQHDMARTEGEFAGARRTLLLDLYSGEPKTVPQMARARGASRQYMQMVVNPLVKEGYLELLENPAHKRSRLVQLTGRGKEAVEKMSREEMEFLQQMDFQIQEKRLLGAAETLEQVRKLMESERWQGALAENVADTPVGRETSARRQR